MSLPPISRRQIIGGGVVAAAGGGLWLASRGGAPAPVKAEKGGTLNMLMPSEPMALSAVAFSGPSRMTGPKINEGLVAFDLHGDPQPQLATRWTISPDFKTYAFDLRRNVRWHDGKPFTSADVANSILTLKQVHPYGSSTLAHVEAVDTPNPHLAVIRLSRPAPALLGTLRAEFSPIFPKHLYAGTNAATNPVNNAPVGTGPFRFVRWVRGSHVLLERNPDYWDPGKPHIDRLVIKFIADAGSRIAAFETGELDIGGSNPIPPNEFARLASLPHLSATTQGYGWMGSITQLVFNLDREPLNRIEVRRAIAHAIDVRTMLDVIWYGRGTVATSPIAVTNKRFHVDQPLYAHDLAEANRLLDRAGLPRGRGGVRFSIAFDYLPYGDGYRQLAQFIRASLQPIGIRVVIRSQDFGAYVRRIYTDRDFDLAHIYVANDFDPSVGVHKLYQSTSFQPGIPFSNGSHYRNAEVDRLLDAASIERDTATRAELYRRFQAIAVRDLPQLNLISFDQHTLFNRRVRNHTVTIDGVAGNFADVYLEQSA